MDELYDLLAACCKKLRLSSNLAARAMTVCAESYPEYLYTLLQGEIERRQDARITRLFNSAGFPRTYDKDAFITDEIVFPEKVNLESILNLDFFHKGKNVIMYGNTGTGKTMLSILIGMSACSNGIPVRFYRTAGLINLFSESKSRGTLTSLKKKLNDADILILDEFGYVPYDRTGAELLFDYLSEIHEKKSVVLNTNLEFSRWVNVLYDQSMTTALIGRLTHHVDLILFPGGNNRLKESSINESFSYLSGGEVKR